MKKEIITIAGSLGSGKSSTARAVASALRFRHFSSGDLFRQIAVSARRVDRSYEYFGGGAAGYRLKVDHLLQEMYRAEESSPSTRGWRGVGCPGRSKFFWCSIPIPPPTHLPSFARRRTDGEDAQIRRGGARQYRSQICQRAEALLPHYMASTPTDPLNFDIVVNTKHNDLTMVTAIVRAAYRAWRADKKTLRRRARGAISAAR